MTKCAKWKNWQWSKNWLMISRTLKSKRSLKSQMKKSVTRCFWDNLPKSNSKAKRILSARNSDTCISQLSSMKKRRRMHNKKLRRTSVRSREIFKLKISVLKTKNLCKMKNLNICVRKTMKLLKKTKFSTTNYNQNLSQLKSTLKNSLKKRAKSNLWKLK